MNQENKEPIEPVKVDRNVYSFNLQKELEKEKVSIPLDELLRQLVYKRQISDFMDVSHVA